MWASALSPDRPSPEARVRLTARTEKVVVAWISTPPVVDVLICTLQLPPVVVQVFTSFTKVAPAALFTRLNVTVVPFGAGPKPVVPSPPVTPEASWSSWLTVAVIVCGLLTSLVADGGERTILASGRTFVNVHE